MDYQPYSQNHPNFNNQMYMHVGPQNTSLSQQHHPSMIYQSHHPQMVMRKASFSEEYNNIAYSGLNNVGVIQNSYSPNKSNGYGLQRHRATSHMSSTTNLSTINRSFINNNQNRNWTGSRPNLTILSSENVLPKLDTSEAIANKNICQILRQLASFVRSTETILTSLHKETCETYQRSINLQSRVDRAAMAIKVIEKKSSHSHALESIKQSNDSQNRKEVLSQILDGSEIEVAHALDQGSYFKQIDHQQQQYKCTTADKMLRNGENISNANSLLNTNILHSSPHNIKTNAKTNDEIEQQLLTHETMPTIIQLAYKQCESPPPLRKLNAYRDDGRDATKFYSDPSFFFQNWQNFTSNNTTKSVQRIEESNIPPLPNKSNITFNNLIKPYGQSIVQSNNFDNQNYGQITCRAMENVTHDMNATTMLANSTNTIYNNGHYHSNSTIMSGMQHLQLNSVYQPHVTNNIYGSARIPDESNMNAIYGTSYMKANQPNMGQNNDNFNVNTKFLQQQQKRQKHPNYVNIELNANENGRMIKSPQKIATPNEIMSLSCSRPTTIMNEMKNGVGTGFVSSLNGFVPLSPMEMPAPIDLPPLINGTNNAFIENSNLMMYNNNGQYVQGQTNSIPKNYMNVYNNQPLQNSVPLSFNIPGSGGGNHFSPMNNNMHSNLSNNNSIWIPNSNAFTAVNTTTTPILFSHYSTTSGLVASNLLLTSAGPINPCTNTPYSQQIGITTLTTTKDKDSYDPSISSSEQICVVSTNPINSSAKNGSVTHSPANSIRPVQPPPPLPSPAVVVPAPPPPPPPPPPLNSLFAAKTPSKLKGSTVDVINTTDRVEALDTTNLKNTIQNTTSSPSNGINETNAPKQTQATKPALPSLRDDLLSAIRSGVQLKKVASCSSNMHKKNDSFTSAKGSLKGTSPFNNHNQNNNIGINGSKNGLNANSHHRKVASNLSIPSGTDVLIANTNGKGQSLHSRSGSSQLSSTSSIIKNGGFANLNENANDIINDDNNMNGITLKKDSKIGVLALKPPSGLAEHYVNGGGSGSTPSNYSGPISSLGMGTDVASILARRIAVEYTDTSDPDSDPDGAENSSVASNEINGKNFEGNKDVPYCNGISNSNASPKNNKYGLTQHNNGHKQKYTNPKIIDEWED